MNERRISVESCHALALGAKFAPLLATLCPAQIIETGIILVAGIAYDECADANGSYSAFVEQVAKTLTRRLEELRTLKAAVAEANQEPPASCG